MNATKAPNQIQSALITGLRLEALSTAEAVFAATCAALLAGPSARVECAALGAIGACAAVTLCK